MTFTVTGLTNDYSKRLVMYLLQVERLSQSQAEWTKH